MKAIAEVLNQTTGNATVSAMAQSKLSDAAKRLIGSRPVFDITMQAPRRGCEWVHNEQLY
jgi:hypothetical protein